MPKKTSQKKIKKIYWLVLLVLILPGFILWGTEAILQNRTSRNYVGIVFGKKVTFDEFKNSLLSVRNQLILQKGEEFLDQENNIDLTLQAWDRIILTEEAKRRKIKINDEEVRDFIQNLPIFWSNKKFNFDLYQQIVRYLFKTTPRLFEEEIRKTLMISKLYEQVTKETTLTDEEIRIAYRRENEMISAEYISIDLKELQESIPYDETKLQQFYLNNRNLFKKPTSFNLQYIMENDLQKAKQLYYSLRKVKNFEAYLSSRGYKINETGFFTLDEPIPGIDWSVSLSFLIESLKVGQINPPVKIKNSYIIIRLKEKRHPYIPLFGEIKEKIKELYLQEEAKKTAKDKLKQVFSEINNLKEKDLKIDFLELAQRYNLKYGTTESFKRSTYIPQIGASDRFFMSFSELKEGQISKDIVEMEKAFFILRIKEYKPIDENIFQKEKEEFTQNLTFKVKDIKFLEFLQRLREKSELKVLF